MSVTWQLSSASNLLMRGQNFSACYLVEKDAAKKMTLKVLADGVLSIVTQMEENSAGKMFRIAEFVTQLEESAEHTIQELIGAEDEEEAR